VSNKRQRTGTAGTSSSPLKPVAHDSDSETSDSDDEWNASGKGKKPKKKKAKTSGAKSSKKATSDNDGPHSDPEEGTVIIRQIF
jgi:RNA polymerase-associated protein RTF1